MKKLYLAGIGVLALVGIGVMALVLLNVNSLNATAATAGGCIFSPPTPPSTCSSRCENWATNGWDSYSACYWTCQDSLYDGPTNCTVFV